MKVEVLIKKVKSIVKKILFMFPAPLPTGMTEFHLWSDEILMEAGFPVNDSFKFALATMILHLPAGTSARSKMSFVHGLKKAAANEIAGAFMHEAKERQKKAAEDEAAASSKSQDAK